MRSILIPLNGRKHLITVTLRKPKQSTRVQMSSESAIHTILVTNQALQPRTLLSFQLKVDKCLTGQSIIQISIKTLKREMKMLRVRKILEMRQTLILVRKIS